MKKDNQDKFSKSRSAGSLRGLLISETFFPNLGGVETFLHNLCCFSSYRVDVLTTFNKDAHDFDRNAEYSIFRIKDRPMFGYISYFMKAIRLLLFNRYDFLFVGTVRPAAYIAILLKKIFNIPLILLYHGLDIDRSFATDPSRLKSLLRHCDLILANSRYSREYYKAKGLSVGNAEILYPGVDTRFFTWAVGIPEEFKNLATPLILSVGRLIHRKNHSMVLRALRMVIGQVPEVYYAIVGDGPQRGALENLVSELDIKDHVYFLGSTNARQLVGLYRACDIFVLPSRVYEHSDYVSYEGFGIVFIEAGACERPVIGAHSGGISEAITHGETGYLVDPDNPVELAERIKELLTDRKKAVEMGKAGRRLAVEKMDWRMVARRFDNMIEEMLKGKNNG